MRYAADIGFLKTGCFYGTSEDKPDISRWLFTFLSRQNFDLFVIPRKIRWIWVTNEKEKHHVFHQSEFDWWISHSLNNQSTEFYGKIVSICIYKPYGAQTTAHCKRMDLLKTSARIVRILKRHVETRNRSPFLLQTDITPNSRSWAP